MIIGFLGGAVDGLADFDEDGLGQFDRLQFLRHFSAGVDQSYDHVRSFVQLIAVCG